ncbi:MULTISPECIES: hypothetical protein [Rhodococcus]|uniref:Uncharacterized protein n=1 Tax=Rhodococcus opacus RKJ300 = JCM 13270 TaxID=1165867 RepID=I0WDL0_RHOOP|nr:MULTISPECIES: hypothetical protein [Rhodococcus]EID74476.1 hypothetical protein W59_29874 [Rhodococcus opacus RKJ300 = JCM 13270]QQZ18445.1 hypothetical protein GO592_40405 [Rhodococcus sp. 21391]
MTTLPTTALDVTRTRYSENQYLTTSDFQVEQDYHRRTQARHELGGHTWGIVVGLDLVETPDTGDPTLVDVHLTPGMAVDGYGRQIVVMARTPVDAALFDAFVDDAHRSVWIEFDETPSRPAEDGWADCLDGQPTRTVENFRLVVDPVDETTDVIVEGAVTAPRPAPSGTTAIPADTSVPYQEVPIEPRRSRWLVRLGDVRWDGTVRRLRQAAAGRLEQGRRYAGSIAAVVLSPDDTLRVARRMPAADPDAAEFARVEGRLRIQGRVNAERELWMEGHALRFTKAAGADDGVPMTLVRDSVGGGHRLRLQLGTAVEATTRLSISAGDASTTSVEVRADGRVRLPVGPLEIGPAALQEVELTSAAYGLGTQRPASGTASGTLYFRSPQRFAWFTGGKHDPAELAPGAGGARRLVLDEEGSLDFGSVTHQMLKLWGSTSGAYGIGVQPYTLYFRTHHDMAWFQGGTHVDVRGGPGGSGRLMMKLDEDNTFHVYGAATTASNLTVGSGGNGVLVARHVNGKQVGSDGADHLYLNYGTGRNVVVGVSGTPSAVEVFGPLQVRQGGLVSVQSVVKVVTRDATVRNGSSGAVGAPGSWNVSWAGEFDEVYTAFVVMRGFSLGFDLFLSSPFHAESTGAIPQHVWAQLGGFNPNGAFGTAFCSESHAQYEQDNHTAITVVAIGRKFT